MPYSDPGPLWALNKFFWNHLMPHISEFQACKLWDPSWFSWDDMAPDQRIKDWPRRNLCHVFTLGMPDLGCSPGLNKGLVVETPCPKYWNHPFGRFHLNSPKMKNIHFLRATRVHWKFSEAPKFSSFFLVPVGHTWNRLDASRLDLWSRGLE